MDKALMHTGGGGSVKGVLAPLRAGESRARKSFGLR